MSNIEQILDNILSKLPDYGEFSVREIINNIGKEAYKGLQFPMMTEKFKDEDIPKIEKILLADFAVRTEGDYMTLTDHGRYLKAKTKLHLYSDSMIANRRRDEILRVVTIGSAITAFIMSLTTAWFAYDSNRISKMQYEQSLKIDTQRVEITNPLNVTLKRQ